MTLRLETPLCAVRSFRAGDLEDLVVAADDLSIWLQLRDRFPHPYTREDGESFLSAVVGVEPETTFAIEVDGRTRGAIGIVPGSDVERVSGEVGYWLATGLQRRGIGTAALSVFLPFAFEAFALERIFAMPFSGNVASRRILEKAGFTQEALLRRSAVKDGRVLDQALYARWKL